MRQAHYVGRITDRDVVARFREFVVDSNERWRIADWKTGYPSLTVAVVDADGGEPVWLRLWTGFPVVSDRDLEMDPYFAMWNGHYLILDPEESRFVVDSLLRAVVAPDGSVPPEVSGLHEDTR
ncbi:MAG: hypothetical protein R3F34_05580 [Planctomycetota bacterium]